MAGGITDHILNQIVDAGKKRLQELANDVQTAAAHRDIYRRALERIARTRGCDCWRQAQEALDNANEP